MLDTGSKTILILGATGGIGGALLDLLLDEQPSATFLATYNKSRPALTHSRVTWIQCDVSSEDSIAELAEKLRHQGIQLNWVLNTVGILHVEDKRPEKSITQFDADFFMTNMQVNCMPTLLLGKHLMRNMDKSKQGIFLTVSAKVGSISDNYLGGWYSYRCSKSALNMALKTVSLEFQRTLPKVSVAAVHPGTTESALSGPFTKNTAPEKLFSPVQTAAYIYDVILGLNPSVTGRFWSWDASELPW